MYTFIRTCTSTRCFQVARPFSQDKCQAWYYAEASIRHFWGIVPMYQCTMHMITYSRGVPWNLRSDTDTDTVKQKIMNCPSYCHNFLLMLLCVSPCPKCRGWILWNTSKNLKLWKGSQSKHRWRICHVFGSEWKFAAYEMPRNVMSRFWIRKHHLIVIMVLYNSVKKYWTFAPNWCEQETFRFLFIHLQDWIFSRAPS